MKALVYTGDLEVTYRDEPDTIAAAGNILVKVEASGICGSDMHAYHGHDERRVPPLILGHEAAGIALGGRYEGQKVAVNPITTCGVCRDCLSARTNLCKHREIIGMRLPGAFAEYVDMPEANLIPVPDKLTQQHASLMEPTAVSLHSVILAEKILHRPISECRTLVIGGGAIGLLAALILNQKGTREIFLSETADARRETIKNTDCCEVFDPLSQARPEENSFDLVIDAVGSGATRADSCRFARPGGVISHIGLQDNVDGLDTRKLTLQEITFIGNYTYTVADLNASLDLLASGGLGSLDWLEIRPMSEGASAFREIHQAQTQAPKIILQP